MARAIDRLIELDQLESMMQHERVAFLAMLDAVVEALPDGLVVNDVEGKVILFNERAEFMFGRHRSEVIGQNVEILLPESTRNLHMTHRQLYSRFDVNPHTWPMGMQLTAVRSDGQEFPADITLSPMVVPRGVYNLALVRYSPCVSGHMAAPDAAAKQQPEQELNAESPHARK